MNEQDDSECPFNYAKNLDREQLEAIANAVLAPLIENRVAFEEHFTLQIEGPDECFEDIVDLLVEPNIENQVASRKPSTEWASG